MSLDAQHGFRAHPDLQWAPQEVCGVTGRRNGYVVKQPWTRQHFQLGEQEYYLLQSIGRHDTLGQVQRDFQAHFAPARLSRDELRRWLHQMQKQGLIGNVHGTTGASAHNQLQQVRMRRWMTFPWQLLSLKLPSLNLEPILRPLDPIAARLFHPAIGLLGLFVALATVVLLITVQQDLLARLPVQSDFWTRSNLLSLGMTFIVVKLIHELAHALVARYWGAECREFGVWLFLMVPVFYCDTSDTWMLPSRWQRISVAAAGMVAELCIACACVFFWWLSEPASLAIPYAAGLAGPEAVAPAMDHTAVSWNSLFLNLFLVCSVGTLLFNANPLVKFDGYYMLSDFLQISNLSEQASAALWNPVTQWFTGQTSKMRLDASPGWLRLYALAAGVYRMILGITVVWATYRALAANAWQPVGDVMVLLAITGVLASPWLFLTRQLRHPGVRGQMWFRLSLSGGMLVVVGALGYLPLPHRLSVPATLQLRRASYLYATAPGQLHARRRMGERVEAGEVVAELIDLTRERERVSLQGIVASHQLRLEHLRKQAFQDPGSQAAIPTTEAAWQAAQQQLAVVEEQQRQLTLRAPQAGILVTPIPPHASPTPNDAPLSRPIAILDPRNQGNYVEAGDLVAMVAEPEEFEAICRVDSFDATQIDVGTPVRLRPQDDPYSRYEGHVTEVSRDRPAHLPQVDETARARGASQTLPATQYWVRIALDPRQPVTTHGMQATARLELPACSLWARWRLFLARTFRIALP